MATANADKSKAVQTAGACPRCTFGYLIVIGEDEDGKALKCFNCNYAQTQPADKENLENVPAASAVYGGAGVPGAPDSPPSSDYHRREAATQ